ncbi:MAG: four helix bundle protein [Burkholderiales bacterium]
MIAARSHQDLIAWQEAMRLVEMIYRHTALFPKEEIFGLTTQLRRSAVSIPSNIAEGAARNSSRELLQFLGIANGSLAELQTQLEIAARLGYLNAGAECSGQVSRVGKLLIGLRKSIRDRDV